MATISNQIWNQTTNEMYNNFYSNASVFKVSRFDVGFWGPYVNNAKKVMETNAVIDPKLNTIVPETTQADALKSYKENGTLFANAQQMWEANH